MRRIISHTLSHGPLSLVTTWSRQSAAVARRNAMAASTACAERSRERLEVNEFISACLAARSLTG